MKQTETVHASIKADFGGNSMGLRTCPDCGAHLDPGEICDCRKPPENLEEDK